MAPPSPLPPGATPRSRGLRPAIVVPVLVLGVAVVAAIGFSIATANVQTAKQDRSDPSTGPGTTQGAEQRGPGVTLRPVAGDGTQVTGETLAQAAAVVRQRLGVAGVTDAQVVETSDGTIVVSLPKEPDQATIDMVSRPVQLAFRPVLALGSPEPAEPGAETVEVEPKAGPDSPSDAAYYVTGSVLASYDALDCTDPANRLPAGGTDSEALVSCDGDGSAKYVLGPVEIPGSAIESASAGLREGPNGDQTNQWVVTLQLGPAGTDAFRDATTRLQGLVPPQNQIAMVLDGVVVTAPSVGTVIADGRVEMSGSFTRDSAEALAGQMGLAAHAVTFEVDDVTGSR